MTIRLPPCFCRLGGRYYLHVFFSLHRGVKSEEVMCRQAPTCMPLPSAGPLRGSPPRSGMRLGECRDGANAFCICRSCLPKRDQNYPKKSRKSGCANMPRELQGRGVVATRRVPGEGEMEMGGWGPQASCWFDTDTNLGLSCALLLCRERSGMDLLFVFGVPVLA